MQNQTQPTGNQDFFNRIWQHFVVEKHPVCRMPSGRCLYRIDNNGCAVGCVIPDNLAKDADRSIDAAIGSIITEQAGLADWLHNVDIELLKEAQAAHDGISSPDQTSAFELNFTSLAERFGLTVPNAH